VNLFWYCHDALEDTTDDTPSKCNDHEAAMIVKFVEYLILNAVEDKKITILTFYTGQKSRLYKKFRGNPNVDLSNGLKIVTVDSYQGEENDIVILSLVRSNLEMNIGFLSVENRVCVALSRAQRGFYIFGNGAMITRVDKLWWDIGDILNKGPGPGRIGFEFPLTCHKHKNRVKISSLSEWENINGGCMEPCQEFLPCGHMCPLFCHPFAHELYRCLEMCNRNPLPCGHDCSKACHDNCYCEECALPLEELQAKADRENKLKDEELPAKASTLTVSDSSSKAKLDPQVWPMPPRPTTNGHVWTRGKSSRT
jgi:helicase required for RNAi-mediated heterochromatin assembly 1